MSPRAIDELRLALTNNEWLQIGDVGVLLEVSRSTVHRMARDGLFRYKIKAGTGNQRVLNPEDVRRALAKKDAVHGERLVVEGEQTPPAPGTLEIARRRGTAAIAPDAPPPGVSGETKPDAGSADRLKEDPQ